jgi:hypothetical protein
MICPYCQQEMTCLSHTLSSMNSIETYVWECSQHPPSLFRQCELKQSDIIDMRTIIVPLKERWYAVRLAFSHSDNRIVIDELEQSLTNHNNFSVKQHVKEVSAIWHITPDNAADKLKTLLVFL